MEIKVNENFVVGELLLLVSAILIVSLFCDSQTKIANSQLTIKQYEVLEKVCAENRDLCKEMLFKILPTPKGK